MNRRIIFLTIVAVLALLCLAAGQHLYAQGETADQQEGFAADYHDPQPAQTSPANVAGTIVKLSLTLMLMVVLIYFTIYLLKSVAFKSNPQPVTETGMLQIIDSLALGPNKVMHVVNVYKQRIILVSCADKEIRVLDKIEEPEKVEQVIASVNQKWNSVKSFKDHLNISRNKGVLQNNLMGHLSRLKGILKRESGGKEQK